MPRVSFLEVLMFVALMAFLGVGIIPRLVQASPEIRASQAMLLEHKLQRLYDAWKLSGGRQGPDDVRNPAALTRNLLICFTSPQGVPFASEPFVPPAVRIAAVYEPPQISPSPSQNRLSGLRLRPDAPVPFMDDTGVRRVGWIVGENFVVAFDGERWHVKALLR